MEEVTHKGRVVDVNAEYVTVEILCESACASCHAGALCGMSEAKKKEIQVPSSILHPYKPGDEVTVSLKASMGHKAVWIGYGIPLVVLFAVLMAAPAFGASELVSGLSAIGAVMFYYFVIWLLRKRLRNEYYFNVK